MCPNATIGEYGRLNGRVYIKRTKGQITSNNAFMTLRAPDTRALYLLSLHNIDALTETNTAMPADFLMLQIEWRETIEDAMLSKDIAKLDDLLIEMRDETNARHTRFLQGINHLTNRFVVSVRIATNMHFRLWLFLCLFREF